MCVALSSSFSLLRNRPAERRRVIIVVGEPRDSGSEEKLGEVLRQAQLSNVVIYGVGLSTTAAELRSPPQQSGQRPITPPGTFGMPPTPGTAQTPSNANGGSGNIDLGALAELAVRNAKTVVKDRPLEVATTAIGGELNAQYTLSYRPAGSDAAGYHQIKVTLDQADLKVRTRPGYYLDAKN